jgi:hypothetical protein
MIGGSAASVARHACARTSPPQESCVDSNQTSFGLEPSLTLWQTPAVVNFVTGGNLPSFSRIAYPALGVAAGSSDLGLEPLVLRSGRTPVLGLHQVDEACNVEPLLRGLSSGLRAAHFRGFVSAAVDPDAREGVIMSSPSDQSSLVAAAEGAFPPAESRCGERLGGPNRGDEMLSRSPGGASNLAERA